MGCGLLTNPVSVRLAALSSTAVYHWFTPWLPAIGLDTVMAAFRAADASSNLNWQLAVQYAEVRTDDPDQPGTLGALQQGAANYVTTAQNIAETTATKMFVRFGIAYKIYTGSGPEQGGPGSWATLGSLQSAGAVCAGELTPTIGSQDIWVQIGLEVSSSDANLARASSPAPWACGSSG